MTRWKMGVGGLPLLALAVLVLAQGGVPIAREAGRDLADCIGMCNAVKRVCKDACNAACRNDCDAQFPDVSQKEERDVCKEACVTGCNLDCDTEKQDCKAMCNVNRQPPSPEEP